VTRRTPPSTDQIEEYRLRSLSEYGPRIEPLLEPGETLRAVGYGDLASVKHPPRRYLPQEHGIWGFLDRVDDLGNKLDFGPSDAFFGLIGFLLRIPPDFRGGWNSQAGRFVIAVSAAAKQNSESMRYLFLGLTDRRVLLAVPPRHFLTRPGDPAQVLGSYGPGQIGRHTAKRRGASDDEVVLGFPDRSYVAVSLNGFRKSRSTERLSEERAEAAVLSQLLPPMAS
jgi:hypothetical protein